MMVPQPRPDGHERTGAVALGTSFLSSSLNALATVSLDSLSPADQVISFGLCSSTVRPCCRKVAVGRLARV